MILHTFYSTWSILEWKRKFTKNISSFTPTFALLPAVNFWVNDYKLDFFHSIMIKWATLMNFCEHCSSKNLEFGWNPRIPGQMVMHNENLIFQLSDTDDFQQLFSSTIFTAEWRNYRFQKTILPVFPATLALCRQ